MGCERVSVEALGVGINLRARTYLVLHRLRDMPPWAALLGRASLLSALGCRSLLLLGSLLL